MNKREKKSCSLYPETSEEQSNCKEINVLKQEIASLREAVTRLVKEMETREAGFSDEFVAKCQQYATLFYGDELFGIEAPSDFESFLFFTDPHLAAGTNWEENFHRYFAQIRRYYHATPTTFCLCGGDWIGAYDLPEEACFKLGYIDGFIHSQILNCYMILGNHDTNYQGKINPDAQAWTTKLSNQANINLWYRKEGKTYFSFKGANTRFYCFDTGAENDLLTVKNNYGWKQALWFAKALKEETYSHIAIALHMLYPFGPERGIQPLSETVLKIAQAYNERKTISVNGEMFDYGTAEGRVEFLIAGHSHKDSQTVICGIPCFECIHTVASEDNASFELVFADYSNRIIHLVRVGYGESREISLNGKT